MSRVPDRFSPLVQALYARRVLSDLDLHLTDRLMGAGRDASDPLPAPIQLALTLASRAIRDSHVCLDLDALAPDGPEPWPAPGEIEGLCTNDRAAFAACVAVLTDPARRIDVFSRFPGQIFLPADTAEEAGRSPPGRHRVTPFVLDGSRLYLRRYWDYERTVAEQLRARAGDGEECDPAIPDARFARIAAALKEEQKEAARRALTRRLCVISGGPGTGKTYTAARILALLSLQARAENRPVRIRVAAPTGKAAGRMHESLEAVGEGSPDVRDALAGLERACTLERLLGYRPGSPYYRHDAEHPLPADVVLVDEASMIDLPKMAKLLEALRPDARLILLGDMHQLASVQPGSVLGEICRSAALRNHGVELKDSTRFGLETPVGRLSAAVNTADSEARAEAAWHILCHPESDSGNTVALGRHALPESLADENGTIDPTFAEQIRTGYRDFLAASTPEAAFAALARFRVLCVLRHGPYGVVTVNRWIENTLALASGERRGPAAQRATGSSLRPNTVFYDHRVLMVLRNDYGLDLYNGDIGVVLPDPDEEGRPTVVFEKHGRAREGGSRFKRLSTRLLPEHETSFAMTVHKSQGSEFEHVLLLLPNQESPILTRETIYTGLTRVTGRIDVWADGPLFKAAIRRTARRFSGLGARL